MRFSFLVSRRLFNLRWCNTLTPRKWNPSTHWSTAGERGRERREGRARGHKLWSPPPPLPLPPATTRRGGFRYPVNFDFHENRTLCRRKLFARIYFRRDFPAKSILSCFWKLEKQIFSKINITIPKARERQREEKK